MRRSLLFFHWAKFVWQFPNWISINQFPFAVHIPQNVPMLLSWFLQFLQYFLRLNANTDCIFYLYCGVLCRFSVNGQHFTIFSVDKKKKAQIIYDSGKSGKCSEKLSNWIILIVLIACKRLKQTNLILNPHFTLNFHRFNKA